jgi:alkylation response protein AidB-like acyl-CoA dehydrogenase
MNFDWTGEENELKIRVSGMLDADAVREAQAMEGEDLAELKRITGAFLRKLGQTGYLGLGLGPAGASDALKLLAAQEEVARISGSLFLAVETTARLFGGLLAGFGPGHTNPLSNEETTGETSLCNPASRGTSAPPSRDSVAYSEVGFPSGEADFRGAYKVFGEGCGEDLFAKRSSPQSPWLERVAAGDVIAAVAVSEDEQPESKSGLSTVAWRDADGFIVSGKKAFVTNAPIADCIAVAASLNGRPAIFLVEPDDPGLVIGPRLETLGYNGLAVASLELREVRVPASRALGPFEDQACIEFLRGTQDMLLAIASVGLMRRTLAEAKRYADSHHRGGKPIFAWQEIRFKIAEMLTLTQTAQLLCYRASWMYSVSDREAATLVHCAKVFSAEASERVASMAMQILAGTGYLSGNPVEQGYREAKYAALAGTTTEIARMLIAEELLNRHQV